VLPLALTPTPAQRDWAHDEGVTFGEETPLYDFWRNQGLITPAIIEEFSRCIATYSATADAPARLPSRRDGSTMRQRGAKVERGIDSVQ
jgi:hypothetical protein